MVSRRVIAEFNKVDEIKTIRIRTNLYINIRGELNKKYSGDDFATHYSDDFLDEARGPVVAVEMKEMERNIYVEVISKWPVEIPDIELEIYQLIDKILGESDCANKHHTEHEIDPDRFVFSVEVKLLDSD